jgi:hypothetical protein
MNVDCALHACYLYNIMALDCITALHYKEQQVSATASRRVTATQTEHDGCNFSLLLSRFAFVLLVV